MTYLESLWPTKREQELEETREKWKKALETPPEPEPNADYFEDRLLEVTLEAVCHARVWESEWENRKSTGLTYELWKRCREDSDLNEVYSEKLEKTRYIKEDGTEFSFSEWRKEHPPVPNPDKRPWEILHENQRTLDEFEKRVSPATAEAKVP